MSTTVADPYRGYVLEYPRHGNRKADGQGNLFAYQTSQTQTRHSKLIQDRFASGSSSLSTSEQSHHAIVTDHPGALGQAAIHDISQISMFSSDQILSRQLPLHFASPNLDLTSLPRGRKRGHVESESDIADTKHTPEQQPSVVTGNKPNNAAHSGLFFRAHDDSSSPRHRRPSRQDFVRPDSVSLPLQNHHHSLPHTQLHSPQSHGATAVSHSLPPVQLSMVGHPGMPDPAPRPRGPKLKFSQYEDALLVELKENKNLTWKQIADFFPGRTSGTLQVRYCTKLKAKDVVWTDEMVQRLQRAIQEYDNDRWRIIAGKVGNGFTPAACREKASQL